MSQNIKAKETYYQEMGFDSPEALAAACDAAHAKVDDIRTKMKSVEASIKPANKKSSPKQDLLQGNLAEGGEKEVQHK